MQGQAAAVADDAIDLRPYVRVLARNRRLIRDITIIAVVLGLLQGFVLAKPSYEAVARVAVVKTRTQVNLDDKIKTLSAETAAAAVSTASVWGQADARTRRATLAALVENPLIAQEVVRVMGDRLPEPLRDPDALLGTVSGRAAKDEELVEIAVRGDDPSLAAEIANAWAANYQREVNRTYSQAGASPGAIDSELAKAKADYDAANEAVIKFTAENREYELARQIDDRKKVIEALQKGRQGAITAIIGKQTDVQAATIGQYLGAALGMGAQPITRQAEAQVQRLGILYAAKMKNQQILEDARTLRAQVSAAGAASSGNDLAIQLLKAQVASSGNMPANLQLRVDNLSSGSSPASQVQDLDGMIKSMGEREQQLDKDIDQQAAELLSGKGIDVRDTSLVASGNSPLVAEAQRLAKNLMQLQGMDQAIGALNEESPLTETTDRLTAEVRGLEAELTRNNATKQELTRARDLAWGSYTGVAAKAQEVRLSEGLPGGEVTFASPATRPSASLMKRVIPFVAIVFAGVVVGVLVAFVVGNLYPQRSATGIPWLAPARWIRRRAVSKPAHRQDVANVPGPGAA